MSSIHLHLDNFNAGELSPLVGQRFGVEKVASGCRKLRNFIPHPLGPVFRRPGMEWMGAAATNASATNLRSFQFSSSTVFVLDLSVSGLRVWKNGALVSLVAPVLLPYAAGELAEVQMTQINDVVYLTHANHEPRRLTRWADHDWRLEVVPWKNPPLLDENPGSQALPDQYDVAQSTVFPAYESTALVQWSDGVISGNVTITGTPPADGVKRIYVQAYYETSPGQFYWLTIMDVTWDGTSLPGSYPMTVTPQVGTYQGLKRIRYHGPAWSGTIQVGGVTRLDISSTHIPAPAAPSSVIVGAGNIRYTVNVSAQWPGLLTVDINRPRYVYLQKRASVGSGAWTTIATIDVAENTAISAILHYTETVELRWRHNGFVAPNGTPTGSIESISLTVPYQTSIAVSNAAVGSGRTLTTNRPLFRAGHVGAFWRLTHRRENAFVQLNPTSAAVAAMGVLTFTAISVAAQTVTIGNRTYTWRASVTTTANEVAIGANQAASQANLVAAINGDSGAGTLYGSQTAPHADVTAAVVGSTVVLTARTPGTGAHSVVLTDTMSNASWGGVYLSGGVAANTVIAAAETGGVRINGTWEVTTYGLWATTLYLERLTASGAWEFVRSWRGNKDRNVTATGTTEGEETLRLRILAGTSEEASTAASPRFLLEAVDARVHGLVKITAVGPLNGDGLAVTATCDVVQACWDTTPTYVWTEGAFSPHQGYPQACALHESRLWFAGTARQPMRLWASVTGDLENFLRSSLDDASLSFTPHAGELNPIQWMASQGSDLVIGTNGDEWTVSGEGRPITPTNVNFKRQSAYGSAAVPAILAGEVVVFVQRGGRRVRRIAARSDNTPWATADMTTLADHVAASGIVQMAYGSNPNAVLWAVTTDGKLLGLTLEVEQNVFGWHVHETDGLIESVAVVYGQEADEVWVSVLRGANRSIERLDPRVFARRFDLFDQLIFADAAKVIDLAPASATVGGLSHLNGKTVCVLADGVEHPTRVVSGGSITLEAPASRVVVGLPFTSELQPMRRELQTDKGTAQGNLWRMSRMGVVVHDSRGGAVAEAPASRFERLPFPAGAALYSGDLETAIESNARRGVDVIVKTSAPLPLNIGALVLKLDLYGD